MDEHDDVEHEPYRGPERRRVLNGKSTIEASWRDKTIRASGVGSLVVVTLIGLWYVDRRRDSEHQDIRAQIWFMRQDVQCNNLLQYMMMFPANKDILSRTIQWKCSATFQPPDAVREKDGNGK